MVVMTLVCDMPDESAMAREAAYSRIYPAENRRSLACDNANISGLITFWPLEGSLCIQETSTRSMVFHHPYPQQGVAAERRERYDRVVAVLAQLVEQLIRNQ